MAAPLSPDGLTVAGELERVYDGWSIPMSGWLSALSGEPQVRLGGDMALPVSAQGGTWACHHHMAVAARARSPLGRGDLALQSIGAHRLARRKWWSQGTHVDRRRGGNWWLCIMPWSVAMLRWGVGCFCRWSGRPMAGPSSGRPPMPAQETAGEDVGHACRYLTISPTAAAVQWRRTGVGAVGSTIVGWGAVAACSRAAAPVGCARLCGRSPVNHSYEAVVEVRPPRTEAGLVLQDGRGGGVIGAATAAGAVALVDGRPATRPSAARASGSSCGI